MKIPLSSLPAKYQEQAVKALHGGVRHSRIGNDPLGEAVREHRFAPPRRFRFDYAWIDKKVALEVEGGIWTGGRHTRGTGFLRDMVKYNLATVLGWRVVRCTPSTLNSQETHDMLRALLQ